MADNDDKPLHVSANDKTTAERLGLWILGSSHERNRLRAGLLAAMFRMADSERGPDYSGVSNDAREVRRLAVLLAQHIDENGV